MSGLRSSCDLHVHSRYSTDSGNFALRRARLGESYTEPGRIYESCLARGMTFVTISDHNTLDGALRIAHLPGTFLSEEVTTRFPEDDLPLHVLVWDLTEEDHRDLQGCRASVYELVEFLRERGLRHALAHPLYRMGPQLTRAHIERLMLLFGIWEGRNGARPQRANELAGRLAQAATPEYLVKLADRHGLAPTHRGVIALTGGSDDHGGIDIATTWTEAPGRTPSEFLSSVDAAACAPAGAHGSTQKLAHAVVGLFLNAYRESGAALPSALTESLLPLFDEDCDDPERRHREIAAATTRLAAVLAAQGRAGGVGLDAFSSFGRRASMFALSGLLQAPYLGTAHHHAGSGDLDELEATFFAPARRDDPPRALVFTDTIADTNGVAGTMRMLAAAGARGDLQLEVVAAGDETSELGAIALTPDWSIPLPGYEELELRFPMPTAVLELVEAVAPDVVHVATPGPVGACGLLAAKVLGIPVVGSWHTELGPYALHLTRDLLVAEAFERYVQWFYRQCDLVLAPTRRVQAELDARGFAARTRIWGRGVDTELFTPYRRDEALRHELLDGAETLLLSVGRISAEKGVAMLFDAYRELDPQRVRLVVVGDGPSRRELEASAPPGVCFRGELHGAELASAYASADVFCFPSQTDTFGQVVLEASASGLPVVAVNVGGAAELVHDRRTGLLAQRADAAAFRDALRELIADEPLRRRLGAAARAEALEHTWKRSYRQLLTAYGEATARSVATATAVLA